MGSTGRTPSDKGKAPLQPTKPEWSLNVNYKPVVLKSELNYHTQLQMMDYPARKGTPMAPDPNNILNTVKSIADILGDVKSLLESMKWFLLWLSPFMNQLWVSFYIRWVLLPELAPQSYPKTAQAYKIGRLLFKGYTVYRTICTIILLLSFLL